MKIFIKKFSRFTCLNYPKENWKGFTLTELLVTITILIIIINVVFISYDLSQKAYRKSEITAEITQNGRVILERVVREIRQAKEIMTELSDEEIGSIDSIEFQDGHDISSIHYIHYFRDDVQQTVKREELAYYFSLSGDPNNPDTYVTWNTLPPVGEELASTILRESEVIGEYVTDLKFWGSKKINISLSLEKKEKTIKLKTQVFGRNL